MIMKVLKILNKYKLCLKSVFLDLERCFFCNLGAILEKTKITGPPEERLC